MISREIAWRVFAEELNSASFELKGEERKPSYLITQLGAKVSRVFIVGVLTEKSPAGEDMLRARVADPTGIFTVYAGKYQPEQAQKLSQFEPPCYIAIVGKVRTYSPEENIIYVSVRPEILKQVSAEIRDYWVVDTCMHMKERIELMRNALSLTDRSIEKIASLGASKHLAEGIYLALNHYENVELEKYAHCLEDALKYASEEPAEELGKETVPAEKEEEPKKEKEKAEALNESEVAVLKIIEELDTGRGAVWDKIIEKAKSMKLDKDDVEEALNSLMDKGLIYEPILGRIKRI